MFRSSILYRKTVKRDTEQILGIESNELVTFPNDPSRCNLPFRCEVFLPSSEKIERAVEQSHGNTRCQEQRTVSDRGRCPRGKVIQSESVTGTRPSFTLSCEPSPRCWWSSYLVVDETRFRFPRCCPRSLARRVSSRRPLSVLQVRRNCSH